MKTMNFSFTDNEDQVRHFWHTNKIFEQSLERTKNCPKYTSYDGPPFATGLPHHGHLLASTIKDTVHRFFTQKGFYVERRFGWDCHGLPIEHEINKSLGVPAHEAVEQLGIAGYNKACRDIVMRYREQWRGTIDRLGRWVDFDNDYKTMDCSFMESVWWVFGELWKKNMIYEGTKVVPFSTALETALSNFEAGSNYQSVQDPAITVLIQLIDEDADIAIWTTTPWTLPANLAVAAHPEMNYAKVEIEGFDRPIWMAHALVEQVVGKKAHTILDTQLGAYLIGKQYHPIFSHIKDSVDSECYQIYAGDFIQTDTGTGLVHMAPAFGEDDFELCKQNNIKTLYCPINSQGKFDESFSPVSGMYIKDADKTIIKLLKEHKALLAQSTVVHNYPFCPRSDTPLIYKAIPSWFVRVTDIKEKLIESNKQIHWVPEHLKEGRYGKWIANARDWAISRNRVWGTPLPLWRNNETGNIICIDSIDTLEQYTGKRLTDLHREHVDPLTFSIDGEEGTYERISEVLDCWFESGSMPYAHIHYPFQHQNQFEERFPAQFIAEGLDQTRAWFYTLNVLSVILYDQPAFKNVIVNGIVLAEDGKKMSKRLRNYTPPDELMATYGADALRLYMISSNLVKGEEQRFSDDGVKNTVKTALLPWYNAYKFFTTYAKIDNWQYSGKDLPQTDLDRWIISRLQTLKKQVNDNMMQYKLYLVVPSLLRFIEELTNTYIRMNRNRFWGEGYSHDKDAAYHTLYTALIELSQLMAPFAPYLSESTYQTLKEFNQAQTDESVHLCTLPVQNQQLQDESLELGVQMLQEIINMARQQRIQSNIKTKTPLPSITVIHKDITTLKAIEALSDRLCLELNVKNIYFSQAEEAYVELYAKPNLPVLGKKYGKRLPQIKTIISNMGDAELRLFEQKQSILAEGLDFAQDDLLIYREIKANIKASSNRYITVSLDTTLTPELIQEGLAREIVSQIQKTRKELNLQIDQRISLVICAPEETLQVINNHKEYILGETLCTSYQVFEASQNHDFEEVSGSFSIISNSE